MEDQSTYVEIKYQGKELKILLFLVCQKTQNVVGIANVYAYGVIGL
jgi:hypothetical protein